MHGRLFIRYLSKVHQVIGGIKLKYRSLILDHDDTAVKSTPDIHYPSFIEALKVLRPDMEPLSLEQFVSYCFNPGFLGLCKDILKFNEAEQQYQYKVWKSYTKANVPDFYTGFPELIKEYKEAGGIICVVSHSEKEQILRDYKLNCKLAPDLIFGWELEEKQRKPNPYPILEIMKRFNLDNDEILVVDDSKPGLDMARSCNVKFAAAGWSHIIPEIKDYMKINSDFYFPTVDSFKKFILPE
jgi:phosphoglycolate phosphatase-like HAD superfamily hydrolase